MAKRRTDRDPFEVTLSEEKQEELLAFLVREIDYAVQARESIVGDNQRIDQAHIMYEGGDGSTTKDTPWPGASNLGSFIVTEKVDALRARMVATIYSDPVWIVEGFGQDASKAPIVEMFHQWKSEESKLQTFLTRWFHNALLEGTGVLEVSDRVVLRRGLRKMNVLLQQDAQTGGAVFGPGGYTPVRDKNGKYVEAQDNEPHAVSIVSDIVRASAGPSFRVLSLKDFFIMPGHATEREDIWGYAKRVYRRLGELRCRERDGFYQNVENLTENTDRQQTPSELRAGQDIAPAIGDNAEKELWEVTLLADLDDDGYEEWYVVTLSKVHRTLLRVQFQDYGTPHYVLAVPYPRPNSVYGYSYAIDKMGTLYDEHAALRNMYVDRMNLATNAPLLQVIGSEWKPSKEPFGPGRRIRVRDINEIKQLEVADVPRSVVAAIQMVMSAAERISGQNDTTTGHLAQQDRTLGEIKIVAEQSFVRIDEAIKNVQEGMEDLFDLLHMIWLNKLEQDPEPLPGDLLASMQERGVQIPDGQITADMLRGAFRGKGHGSVESADFSAMRQDFGGLMTALTQLSQAVPAVRQHLNNPQVVRSIVGQLARIYRWPDRANLVGTFTGQVPPQPPPPPKPPEPMRISLALKGEDLARPEVEQVFEREEQLASVASQAINPPATPGAPMTGAPPNVTPPSGQ